MQDYRNGNQVLMVDPLGRRIEYRYDSRNRLVETVNPDGSKEKMRYDSDNNLTASFDAKGNRTNKVYDARGRLIREVDATEKITRFEYDAANQMVAQIDANNNRTEYKYDELERRIEVIEGAKTSLASTSKTEYDKVGNVTAEVDGNTNKTQYVYDARNRQTRVIDALNPSGTTTTEYDDVGNITSIKDQVNNTTQFIYDARNRLKSETNQFGKARAFEYDDVGNRTQITDRNNRVRSFTYDGLNRETAENWLNTTSNPIRTITSTYDAASQLTSVKDPDSTYQFSYDPKGRQIAVDNTGTPGVPNVLLNYTYDDEDNLLSVKDTINGTLSGTTAYSYDTLNRINRITQSGNGVASKRVDFGYDNIGQLKSVNRYSDLSGSQLVRGTTYTYDAKNRLDVLSHGSGVSYDFDYDNGNRITKITDIDGITNYTYDKNNQLTVADYSNSNKPDENFSYDANGNRTSSGYQTGTNNRLLSDGTFNYAYDDEGNLILRTEIATNKVTEYEWDYRNRLAGVFDKNATGNVTQEVGFKYDSQNRRISKKVGSTETRFVYDRDNVLFDFAVSGANKPVLDKRYFHGTGVDQVLAQESGNGSVLWGLSDQLGTVKDWVNSSGSVANHVVYDAFGGVVSQSISALGSRYGFTGRELDGETGLYYYRSRYYNPGIGRFIGEDSVGFGGGDANLYRYVGNSPVDRIDPSGTTSFPLQVLLELSRPGSTNRQVYTGFPPAENYDQALIRATNWFYLITIPEKRAYGDGPVTFDGTVGGAMWSTYGQLRDNDLERGRGKATLRPSSSSEPHVPTIDLKADYWRLTHNTPGHEAVKEVKFRYVDDMNNSNLQPCQRPALRPAQEPNFAPENFPNPIRPARPAPAPVPSPAPAPSPSPFQFPIIPPLRLPNFRWPNFPNPFA